VGVFIHCDLHIHQNEHRRCALTAACPVRLSKNRKQENTMLRIIPLYASLLALFYVYLSARTIGVRRKARISIGDGGDDAMLRAMRMHANFAEYAPISLVLLAMVDMQGGPVWLLHALGFLLLAARLSHAYGISSVQAPGKFRVGGMVGTFATMTVASCWLLNAYFISL
jgi:uncharacterized membrane protein YecN with MAPEG domain